MAKNKKIRILSSCRVDGKSLAAGKSYTVSEAGALGAVGAGRAAYETASAAGAKKSTNQPEGGDK